MTFCYHQTADKANICAMFLSYLGFRGPWRSLGKTASAHRNPYKTGTNRHICFAIATTTKLLPASSETAPPAKNDAPEEKRSALTKVLIKRAQSASSLLRSGAVRSGMRRVPRGCRKRVGPSGRSRMRYRQRQ